MMFIMQGCGSKTICPKYPKPSQATLIKISTLKDAGVDIWMKKQFKLNLKLNECNKGRLW